MFSFLILALVANVVLSVGMDTLWPSLRDAEYTCRRERVQARVAANPERPLAVVLGSSRTDFGIRPLAADAGPLVCNVSQIGAGPLIELLTLRRLLHDGIEPQELIVEFWPPCMMGKGAYSEFVRLDPHRYFATDEPFIRDYLPDPEETLRLMREIRRTPFWNHRQRLMSRTLPTWLPLNRRLDGGRARVDAAGWLPGPAMPADPEAVLRKAAEHFQPQLLDATIEPHVERALREIIAIGQSRGRRVTLIWMPESSRFRSWYPAATETLALAFLAKLQNDTGARVINARDWMPDDDFPDGYHLSPDGAAGFTQRLFTHFP